MPIEQRMVELVNHFCAAPQSFFHERELHAPFYSLCRDDLPMVATQDGHHVHLFRYEYETVWRYARRDPEPFTERLTDRGRVATIDFAVLNSDFAQGHDLLSVINKHEGKRANLRGKSWKDGGASAMIDVAIEFKMAHRRHQMDIGEGQINTLRRDMLLDARKLATERIARGYLLGFSHGPRPNQNNAEGILRAVLDEHSQRRDNVQAVQLQALQVTPSDTFLAGEWEDPGLFPNPVRVT